MIQYSRLFTVVVSVATLTIQTGALMIILKHRHASLTNISFAQIDIEIQRLDEAFVNILGVKPRFFRYGPLNLRQPPSSNALSSPPYGDINDDIATYIQQTVSV